MQLSNGVRDANGARVPSSASALDASGQSVESSRPAHSGAFARALPRTLPKFLFLFAASLATIALWIVSRGKWGYAIVDSGREWIVPEALARGELLYRDVVYWFGPLTPYLHALLFRIFGATFQTLVLGGILASVGVLAALYAALRKVTGREEAFLMTALAIPLLIFMPAAGGAILGMGYRMWHAAALTLWAVAVAVKPRWSVGRAAAIGSLAALAGLCRTEWGLAAMGGAAVVAAVRDRFRPHFLRDAIQAGIFFSIVFGGVLAVFIRLAGARAVLDEGHVLLTGIPPETRRFLLNMSGFHDPIGGFIRLLFSTALWAGLFLLLEVIATRRSDPDLLRRRLPWFAGIAVLLWVYRDYSGWPRFALMSVAPVIGLAALIFGLRRAGSLRPAALAGFGSLTLVLSYRKLFSISDSPYVAPPLLFALVAAAGFLHEWALSQRTREGRAALRRWHQVAIACLVGVSFLDRLAVYAEDGRVPIPGTDRMLSARVETVQTLTLLSQTIRDKTKPGDGLVVIPEGEILNYLSDRPNPIPHKLYLPGYLSRDNEAEVLRELQAAPPAAIVIPNRATPEYGRRFFGEDYAKSIATWINEHYVAFSFDPAADRKPDESGARLFFRRR